MLLRSASAPILKSWIIDPSPEQILKAISASISISSNHDPITKKISKTASDHTFNELYKAKIKTFPKGGSPLFASKSSENQENVSKLSFGVSTVSLVSKIEALDQECAVLENGGSEGGRICGGGGSGGGGSGGDGSDHGFESIEDYYEEMIKVDPNNPLILGNYAKFLKEVKGDVVKAEEYCGRAILANANDGDIFSLYGDLVWDVHKDAHRAESYYNQAVKASPDDCYVLASYARFLWDAGDDDEEGKDVGDEEKEEQMINKSTMMNTSVNFFKGLDSLPSPSITAA